MAQITNFKHDGLDIFYTDLSNSSIAEAIPLLQRSTQIFSQYPSNSIYSLVNMEEIKFNSILVEAIREATKKNTPFVKATAVCGLKGLGMIMANSILSFAGRKAKFFDSVESGKHWLYKESLKESIGIAS